MAPTSIPGLGNGPLSGSRPWIVHDQHASSVRHLNSEINLGERKSENNGITLDFFYCLGCVVWVNWRPNFANFAKVPRQTPKSKWHLPAAHWFWSARWEFPPPAFPCGGCTWRKCPRYMTSLWSCHCRSNQSATWKPQEQEQLNRATQFFKQLFMFISLSQTVSKSSHTMSWSLKPAHFTVAVWNSWQIASERRRGSMAESSGCTKRLRATQVDPLELSCHIHWNMRSLLHPARQRSKHQGLHAANFMQMKSDR